MIVEQIWTNNNFRNFNYLIVCPETGEALAVDPLEFGRCLDAAKDKGWEITQILNTHHHNDHTGGNGGMVEATGAKILANAKAKDDIPDMDIGLNAGDVVKVGKTVELEAMDTPGHTMSHVCLLSRTDQPGADMRRYAIQRGRRALQGRRPPGAALRNVRQTTGRPSRTIR